MFIALALATLLNDADPSGIWRSTDGTTALVITRQEYGWNTEWWWLGSMKMYGSAYRAGPCVYHEWFRCADDRCITGECIWNYYPHTQRIKYAAMNFYRLQ